MLTKNSLLTEKFREYDFGGRVYRINSPKTLYMRPGGTTHRIVDKKGLVHCVPAPGINGCVLRWENKDSSKPCEF
jgi:hypothetical protein